MVVVASFFQTIISADSTLELFKTLSETRWSGGEAGAEKAKSDGVEDNPLLATAIRAEQQRFTSILPDHR